MTNNDDKKLNNIEVFELREKRLKLVYKILYVVVAIWLAVLLNISQNIFEKAAIPMYAFILSTSSMIILQIIKYIILEFRCMRIIGDMSEEVMNQTENRYDKMWKLFPLILSLCGLAIIPHYIFLEQISTTIFMTIFCVCLFSFAVTSFVRMFKKNYKEKTIRIFDLVGIIIGSIAAYSLWAALCLITSAI